MRHHITASAQMRYKLFKPFWTNFGATAVLNDALFTIQVHV